LLKENYEVAHDACAEGVKLRSSCPVAHGIFGLVQTFSGEYHGAVKSAIEGIKLERLYPTWLVSILAMAHRDDGNVNDSISIAREALKLEPGSIEPKLILCNSLALASQTEQAQSIAEEIMLNNPSFSLSDYMTTLHYQDRRKQQSIDASLRLAGLPD
jgi:adenylate cyclase